MTKDYSAFYLRQDMKYIIYNHQKSIKLLDYLDIVFSKEKYEIYDYYLSDSYLEVGIKINLYKGININSCLYKIFYDFQKDEFYISEKDEIHYSDEVGLCYGDKNYKTIYQVFMTIIEDLKEKKRFWYEEIIGGH